MADSQRKGISEFTRWAVGFFPYVACPEFFHSGRVVAAAVVGGSVSAATGGKFANGAVTGAFSRAFNDEQESKEAELFGTRDKVLFEALAHAESGSSQPFFVSASDFEDVMSSYVLDARDAGIAGYSFEEFEDYARSSRADTIFFHKQRQNTEFVIGGLNGNRPIIGSDINYFNIGILSSVGGFTPVQASGFAAVHNTLQIIAGDGSRAHNARQIFSVQEFVGVGFSHHQAYQP